MFKECLPLESPALPIYRITSPSALAAATLLLNLGIIASICRGCGGGSDASRIRWGLLRFHVGNSEQIIVALF